MTRAHDLLAEALGQGHDVVLAEERRVWRELAAALAREAPACEEEARLLVQFEEAFWWWAASGELVDELYLAQRRLFVLTEGRIADLDLAARRRVHPSLEVERPVEGVLGMLMGAEVRSAAEVLARDGCLVFPAALEAETCAALEHYARVTPSRPLLGGGKSGAPIPWHADRAQVTRATIGDAESLARPELRALAFDETLLAIARAYLGVEPTVTKAMLRWSAPVLDEPDSQAAQLFHFDLNRLNFLKAFVYLNDVGPENGPHCFVRGSHRRRPKAINRDGRLTHEEVAGAYPTEDMLELTGPRGTIILADTRGLHRGKMLTEGDRIVFNLVYSGSLAGKQLRRVGFVQDEPAREAAARHPRIWYGLIRPLAGQIKRVDQEGC